MTTVRQSHAPAVRPAAPADARRIAGTLADAFVTDPVVAWFRGQVRDPQRRLEPTFLAIARRNLERAEPLVFVAGDVDSVAVWRGVDAWRHPPGELLRSLPANVRSFRRHMSRVLRTLAAVERAHPEEPHYYLSALGTRTDAQGRGLGSAALAPMLQRCDDEGMPAFLESSNPRNVPFYARHGFERRGEIPLPKGCPPIVPMWRDPR